MRRSIFCLAITVLVGTLLFLGASATAAPLRGVLDRSFGHGGSLAIGLPSGLANSDFAAMVRQPDGKLVLGGRTSAGQRRSVQIVERRLPNGELDRGFGSGGIATVSNPGYWSQASALSLQPDGRILVGIGREVRRLLANGASDPSFGEHGFAELPISAYYLAVDREGGTIVAGTATHLCCGHDASPVVELAVARLRPNGSLDTGFGNGGVVKPNGNSAFEQARGLAVRENGTILVAGENSVIALSKGGNLESSFGRGGIAAVPGESTALLGQSDGGSIIASRVSSCSVCRPEPGDFTLTRYRADGSRDPGFGSDGIALFHVSEINEATALASAGDGKFLMAGRAGSASECQAAECGLELGLVRFDAIGQVDSGFGHNGWAPLGVTGGESGYEFSPRVTALAISAGGRIAAAGGSRLSSEAFVLGREADGALDPGFGSNGSVFEHATRPSNARARHLTFDSGGRILVSALSAAGAHRAREILVGLTRRGEPSPAFGETDGFTPTGTSSRFLVAGRSGAYAAKGSRLVRFTGSGQRDLDFGVDGEARLPDGFAATSAAVRRDGRILVGGNLGKHADMAVFQLTMRGSPDRSFGRRGFARIKANLNPRGVQSIAIDHRGRAVVVGGSKSDAVVARLRRDGKPERSFGYRGRLKLPANGAAIAQVTLLPRGAILIGASPTVATRTRFVTLMRLGPHGALDTSFGRRGALRVAGRSPMLALSASAGQIVVALRHGRSGDGYGIVLRGYLAKGQVDRRFGRNGRTDIAGPRVGRFRPAAAGRQPGGRLVIVGTVRNRGSRSGFPSHIELLRFR